MLNAVSKKAKLLYLGVVFTKFRVQGVGVGQSGDSTSKWALYSAVTRKLDMFIMLCARASTVC